MSGWSKFEITVPEFGIGDFTEIIDKIKEFIDVIATILDTLLTFITAITDPLAAAIKAIIDALKNTIESFLEDMGGYILYVPIRRRLMTNFLGYGDITPKWASDIGLFSSPGSQLNSNDPAVNAFLTNMNKYNGGNVGFYRTVSDSLADEGDADRPQFTSENDWVGGVIILMGTNFDPLGFLDDIWRLFGIFGFPDSAPKIPRPQNLRARAITKVLGGSFSVLLKWDPVEVPLVHLEDLGDVSFYPDRYAIIRIKNDPRALCATNVVDLMGTRDLEEGLTFNNGYATVIKEGKLDIARVSYTDTKVPAIHDDTFYYAIAWRLLAFSADKSASIDFGNAEAASNALLPYWYISNIAQVIPYPTLSAVSTPPNWRRTPSIASLFPPLADMLRRIVLEIENFADKLLGVTDLLRQYVDFLKAEIARYEAIVNELLDMIAKILALLNISEIKAGLYIRTFKGMGGNTYFQTDLAKSLMPAYETAPPFHNGDEYVTGLVLMTGGYKADVEAFMTAAEIFFGSGDEQGVLQGLTETLGAQVEQLENIEFDDALDELKDTATYPTMEFDDSLNTKKHPPKDPVPVIFKGDFTAVPGEA
jgi:hypothetical protein